MLSFDFLDKGIGLVSLSHFMYDFTRELFLMLDSINKQVSLRDCLYFLRYWTICVL